MTAALHTDVAGPEGAPLVVLHHGFAGSARNWRPQMRALRARARVVAYDARGHARSAARLETARFGLDDFARDLGDVADAHGGAAARFVAGGLSLGAAVALRFALRDVSRVRGLVLAAHPAGRAGQGGFAARAEAFAVALEREGLEKAGARFVWGPDSGLDPQAAALVRRGFLEHPAASLAAILRQAIAVLPSPSELAGELAALRVPALVVVGTRDAGSLEPCRELARLLPDATLVEVPGAGHVVNLAAPAAFDAALLAFLDRIDR
ncbi:MAG: alpha/beta fold hydrolase [Myxococcota bacterium]